jgi:cytochrome P450
MTLVQVAAAAALLATVTPLARLVTDADFARVFPRHRRIIGVCLLAWAGVVGAIAVFWPATLVPSALVGVVMSIVLVWLARPHFGVRRGRPPGSLSLTRSLRDLARREALLDLGERHGPVFKTRQPSGPVVCIMGLERGQRLVREHRSAIGPSPLAFTDEIMGGFLRYMDDDTHDVYGPLFRRAMSRSVTDAAAPVTRAATIRSLQRVTATASSPDTGLHQIAYESVLHAMFGIEAASDTGIGFAGAYDVFARDAISHPRHRRQLVALDELRALIREHAKLLDDPTITVAPCALRELRALDAAMPDETCIDNLLFMLRIGSSNVTSLLRWILEHLGSDPSWRARLATESDARGLGTDLHDAFVLETLRLAQSEYVYRRLVDDVEFEGFRLPSGWLVRICVWESHRDPEIFDHPTSLTDRFLGPRPPQTEYCPFGFDRHACNSVGLALMIARTVLEEYCADPDVIVRPSGAVVRDLRHWSHWRPGPTLAVSRHTATESRREPVGQIAVEPPLQRRDVVTKDVHETGP